jgi:hypothetical protein
VLFAVDAAAGVGAAATGCFFLKPKSLPNMTMRFS